MQLDDARKMIDNIDEQVVSLLGARNELAKQIGIIKKAKGLPIYDKAREEAVLKRLAEKAKEAGLDDELIVEIYRLVLADSKRSQEYS